MIIQKQNILSLLLYTPVSILGFSGTFTDSLILAFRTESAKIFVFHFFEKPGIEKELYRRSGKYFLFLCDLVALR
jgi:hypothetical protein